jgi:hypothetical protein
MVNYHGKYTNFSYFRQTLKMKAKDPNIIDPNQTEPNSTEPKEG